MKEQIIYRKVFIHGEEDLPKETGFYIANVKDWGISDRHFLVGDKDYFKGWIEDIDWYLLPVSLPTEKEIHEAAYNACVKPSMPNGEPEPEHAFYDAFVQCADWLKRQITSK